MQTCFISTARLNRGQRKIIMKVVIIICIIWIIGIFFVGWKFIDDRMKRNKLEHAMSLAQHNPKEAVEYLREHIGNQNMPSWQEEKIAESYETVNRLYPQNADWQDWAYLVECHAIIWHNGMGGMLSQLDPEARELLSAVSMRRNPEQQYAREKRWREERAREERAREERQNRWVIVQLAGRPEVRFDISNDKGRASLIRWYNNIFHPEPHETRTVGRTRSGRRVGVKVEKLPGAAAPAGKIIINDVVIPLAIEAGKWAVKKKIIRHPWADIEANYEEDKKIGIELLKNPLLHIRGTDKVLNQKQLKDLIAIEKRKREAEENRKFREAIEAEAEWEWLMEGSGSDKETHKRGLRDRDPSEWPPRKMIKGPQTRHPQGDDGPQTGHPEYE